MKARKNRTYAQQVTLRIRLLWVLLLFMLVYMVAVTELVGRVNTQEYQRLVAAGVDHIAAHEQAHLRPHFVERTGSLIFFSVLIYVITRIVHSKKLLKNRMLLLEAQQEKADERQQFLRDKSGGLIVDILLVVLLLVTFTASSIPSFSPAFYCSLGLLCTTILLKIGSYLYYSRRY